MKKYQKIQVIPLIMLLIFSLFSNSMIYAVSEYEKAFENTLLAHYPLFEDTKDISGNDQDGEVVGNVSFSDGLTLAGGTNSNTNYVRLPDGLFDNQESITISTWLKSDTNSGNYAALFFGTPANDQDVPESYWLFNPTNPTGNFKSVITDSVSSNEPWSTEVGIDSTDTTMYKGVWTHYTTVITSTSITGYINGEEVEKVNKKRDISDFGTELNAYIGRSNYLGDHTFAGSFQDLRIYSDVLDDATINSIYDEGKTKLAVQEDKRNLTLGDTSAVIENLNLPMEGSKGTIISWQSDNENIISNAGIVTLSDKEQTVTLTATLSLGDYEATKDFQITLVSLENITETIVEEMYIPYVLTSEDQLPTSVGVASISWDSSDISVIDSDGNVYAPYRGLSEVSLTATISYEEQQVVKEFNVNVIESSPSYILSYIRMGNNILTDAMHLGHSKNGNDYKTLNNNTGVLFPKADFTGSKLGLAKKLKNPYIFRMEDGTFGVIATEHNGDGSQNAEEKMSALLFESEDLVSFKEVGLIPLNTDETVVEPIAEFDVLLKEYRIEWKTPNGDIYSNFTKDFVTVSEPKSGSKVNLEKVTTDITNAVPNNRIVVTKEEEKVITDKLAKVINTDVSNLEINIDDGQAFTFEDLSSMKVTAFYSDDSTHEKVVNWNQDEFDAIDFSQEGTHTVNGMIKLIDYPFEMIKDSADPNVLLYNDKYYFIATNENGHMDLNVREADSILELKDAASHQIFKANASGPMSGSIWAPELHTIDGDLYILFAAGSPHWYTVQAHMMKLKEGGDPLSASDWEDPIRVVDQNGNYLMDKGVSYDMTYFEHNDDHYLVWNQGGEWQSADENSEIVIAKTNPEKPWELITDPVVVALPEYGWERRTASVVEGSYVIKNDGKLFLTYSGSGVDHSYAIGFLMANEDSDLLDPASWTKNNYPILNSESVSGELGPGHNSYTVDEDGNLINIYHTMPSNSHKRQMSARRVHWAADGTPVLDMILDRDVLPENRVVTATITVGKDDQNEVIGVSLNPETAKLSKGEEILLEATVTPENANNKNVFWTSNNEDVAIVNKDGRVTALSAGAAVIRVTTVDGGYESISEIVVTDDSGSDGEDGTDGEDSTNGKDSTDDKSDPSGKNNDLEKEVQNEQELPSTATNLYNYLIIGIILLVTGSAVVLVAKRRKEHN